jgi:hypothetical protein
MATAVSWRLDWLRARARQIRTAVESHVPVEPPPPNSTRAAADVPDSHTWKAAKSSGLLSLLPQVSKGSDLHPPAAPPGERYALSREERAGAHRISRLLIDRTIPAICIGLRRFCNVIAPSRGRIVRIQCRQVGRSSATVKEDCNRTSAPAIKPPFTSIRRVITLSTFMALLVITFQTQRD